MFVSNEFQGLAATKEKVQKQIYKIDLQLRRLSKKYK